mmetsp:Transcript_36687/g.42646  ORF Transcript_36687/g.42646 Transcript_36687/m.42646 type:complete len:89 (+) Transcript_36687:1058-1324(+)
MLVFQCRLEESLRIETPNPPVMAKAHAIKTAAQLMYDSNRASLEGAGDSGWMRLNSPISDSIGVPALKDRRRLILCWLDASVNRSSDS